MTYLRTPNADASSPHDMATDSKAVELAMHLPRQVARLAQGALDAVPEGLVAATPAPVKKAGVAVSDAAAKFASRFLD